MDGYASGAIVKLKYPDITLRGWDYKDPIPGLQAIMDFDEVILIDITFPLATLQVMGQHKKIIVIDHHISFKKQVDEMIYTDNPLTFKYIYQDNKAACEIGWEYLFPDTTIPDTVTLIGRYDTWRQDEGDWERETLPFKYYMYGNCNSAETFPMELLDESKDYNHINGIYRIESLVEIGAQIAKYQQTMDASMAEKNSFVMEDVMGGHTVLCINYCPFNSEVLKTIWDPSIYDFMVGFCYYGNGKWGVSLRSVDGNPDVGEIAKARGGGGHRNAAGYETNSFDEIFN